MSTAWESTVSSSSSKPPESCAACNGRGPFAWCLSAGDFQLWECPACGLAFLFPQPREEELSDFYDEKYYGKDRRKFVAVLEGAVAGPTWLKWRKLKRLVRPGDRMLDIGCGRGTLLEFARRAGVEAYGIERPSPALEKQPNVFYQELSQCSFPAEHFQLAVLWHVLEHLRDPASTLREICRVLKPGGWLSVAVPHFGGAQARASQHQWFHLDLPRHLWHFRRRALESLLGNCGFERVECSTLSVEYDWFGTLQSWMNRAVEDNNGLYALLKREAPQPLPQAMRRLATATLLAGPALASALWDAARGQGGTLSVLARKRHAPSEREEFDVARAKEGL